MELEEEGVICGRVEMVRRRCCCFWSGEGKGFVWAVEEGCGTVLRREVAGHVAVCVDHFADLCYTLAIRTPKFLSAHSLA